MNKKLLALVALLAFLIVSLVIFLQPPSTPRNTPTQNPLREIKFEYVKMPVEGVDVECKYAMFEQPLKVDRINSIQSISNSTNTVQWLQFVKYTSLANDPPTEFNPEMYNPDRVDRINYYRENWTNVLDSKMKHADTILKFKEQTQMEGVIKGILFLRHDQIEYAVFRYEYGSGDDENSTGEFAIVHNKKLIFLDDEIYKPDFKLITRCFGLTQSEILEKLSHSPHGILKVTDPFHWNIP